MNVAILIRSRQLPGTALPNAARFDADFLESLGHTVEIAAAEQWEEMKIEGVPDMIVVEGAGWYPVKALQRFIANGMFVVLRVHAAPEFIYYEFPGIQTARYIREAYTAGVHVAFVSHELLGYFGGDLLPIVYPAGPEPRDVRNPRDRMDIHVGCFGALRPLKNQIGQFLAVVRARNVWFSYHRFYFHINSTRIEGCDRILPELKALSDVSGVALVGHDWLNREDFKKTVRSMDLGMCASLAESFCLVAADFVSAGVPTVLSSHIPWSPNFGNDTVLGIAHRLRDAVVFPHSNVHANWMGLKRASQQAEHQWTTMMQKAKNHVTNS